MTRPSDPVSFKHDTLQVEPCMSYIGWGKLLVQSMDYYTYSATFDSVKDGTQPINNSA